MGVRRVDDRRREVGVDRQRVDAHPLRDAGPTHLERHPDRLLVDPHLALGDPMLAVEEAVVGRVDDQRVVELPGRLERVDHLLDAVVHRQQRLQLAAVVALDVDDRAGVQAGTLADRGRLVGDVGLVEVRGPWQRLGVEGVGVSRWRLGGVVAVGGRVGVRVRATAVRRAVGQPEEERLRLRGAALDQVNRLPGEDVLLVVPGPLPVARQLAVVVRGVVVGPVGVRGRRRATPTTPAVRAACSRTGSGTCRPGRCSSRRGAARWRGCCCA